MDFFNYAGIHRDAILYIKPVFYIRDIFVNTSVAYSDKGNFIRSLTLILREIIYFKF